MTEKGTNTSCRSWFLVFNNPEKVYEGFTPEQICEKTLSLWVDQKPEKRTGVVLYCISSSGLHHLHMVLEDSSKSRFSSIKKLFPESHIEPTMGTKSDVEDYIHKRGKFEEKGEIIVCSSQQGEVKGRQGKRSDLSQIEELLNQGLTPKEIFKENFGYRKYDKMIRQGYYDKRCGETPLYRDVKVFWHVGESGSGKTHTFLDLCHDHGEDHVYIVSDYQNGGFDLYNGEQYLFLDEFRGQIPYSSLLSILEGYKKQYHSRYTNIYMLWDEVHISTVLPPEDVYKNMVQSNQSVDTMKQLMRRITSVIYHYKDESGYHQYEIPGNEYISYESLKIRVGVPRPVPFYRLEVNPFK